MKSIFDKVIREEFTGRINLLNENSIAQWGSMTVSKMLKHCTQWEEMILGKRIYTQSFLGKLFGRSALKSMIKDDIPLKRNMPTVPSFKIKENCDVASEIKIWIALIKEHDDVLNPGIVHPFFGKITREQLGYLAYKHTDHHLRQFNV